MYILIVISGLLAFVSSKPFDTEGSTRDLLLSLNKELLYSLETQEGIPNPSVHLALRLSGRHNLVKESEHLNKLKTRLHDDIQNSLSNSQSAVGLLALYSLALKASCYDLSTITFKVNNRKDTLLIHLKRQMEQEKDHIAFSHRPLTNYYQYSLGVLALCVSGIRVNHHVSNKLMKAVQQGHINHGGYESIDTLAMAGMALQCVKDGSHVQNTAELDTALSTVKQKLLASKRADGHMGNEFSTGLAVQALLAMGSQVEECAASMEAMRADARRNTYHDVMAISQTLPALQHRSYLDVKSKECTNEDDSLVVEPRQPVVVALPSQTTVAVNVEVVRISGSPTTYTVDVPKSSTLLETLELLQSNTGFTFVSERSLWGAFLSVVNGEQARISDRRYWQIASDDTALTQGISDYTIERGQKITIKNTTY